MIATNINLILIKKHHKETQSPIDFLPKMTEKDQAAIAAAAAAERKRKRLEAWRKRQEQKAASARQAEESRPTPKVKLSFGTKRLKKKRRVNGGTDASLSATATVSATTNAVAKSVGSHAFNALGDHDGPEEDEETKPRKVPSSLLTFQNEFQKPKRDKEVNKNETSKRKRNRWDVSSSKNDNNHNNLEPTNKQTNIHDKEGEDGLDIFMKELQAGAMGNVQLVRDLSIDVSGSMIQSNLRPNENTNRSTSSTTSPMVPTPTSGGVITPDELAKLSQKVVNKKTKKESRTEDGALYGPSDWESEKENASASEVRTQTPPLIALHSYIL